MKSGELGLPGISPSSSGGRDYFVGVWQILQRGWGINGRIWTDSVRGLCYFGSYKVRKKKWQHCQKFFVRGLLCTRKIVFCEEKVAILPFFLPRNGMVFSVLPHPLACPLAP